MDKFFDAISNPRCLKTKTSDSVKYLHDYLRDLGCQTMLIENQYVDKDFLDDYANYYVKCFEPYPRFCKRVHFFKNLSEQRVCNHLKKKQKNSSFRRYLNANYLGSVVAKPLPSAIIGRTVLNPYENTITDGEEVDGERTIRCARAYPANLFGVDLTTTSLAFIEQDQVISACATSALWIALQKSAHLFGYRIPGLYEITDCATRYWESGRPIPSEGLNTYQMCQAIREVGLEPEVKEVYASIDDTPVYKYPLLAASYGYLRAGIPIVLKVMIDYDGFHAITLTGYRLAEEGPGFLELDKCSLDLEKWAKPHLRGSRIKYLYAHDDQIGPFCKLQVKSASRAGFQVVFKGTWKREDRSHSTLVPLEMITPVYHKIRVPFVSVLRLASRMGWLFDRLGKGTDEIEWDIFLSSVNDYKREVVENPNGRLAFRSRLLEMNHPRFVWRARAYVGGEETCEMLVDATDMEKSFNLYAVMFFDPVMVFRFNLAYDHLFGMVRPDRFLPRMMKLTKEWNA